MISPFQRRTPQGVAAFPFGFRKGKQGAELVLALLEDRPVLPFALRVLAARVLLDDRGRARGVAYFDEDDRLQEQPADLVVVSGGATESARLLLLSKSRLHPNGLGNRHDWVGRNLTGHTYTGAVGFFEQVTYDDLGPGVCISVCDYNHGNPGLAGGAIAGGLWGAVPGWLKARFGAHEVINTIMMNYIALGLVSFLLNGPMKDPSPGNVIARTPEIAATARIGRIF